MRHRRVRRIRGRVIGYSVALFMVVWAVIAVVLVSGHDPALAHKSTSSTAATGAGSTSGDSATTSGWGSGSDDSSGFGSSGDTGSSSPTPLTSSQS